MKEVVGLTLSAVLLVAVAAWVTVLPSIGLLYVTGYIH